MIGRYEEFLVGGLGECLPPLLARRWMSSVSVNLGVMAHFDILQRILLRHQRTHSQKCHEL